MSSSTRDPHAAPDDGDRTDELVEATRRVVAGIKRRRRLFIVVFIASAMAIQAVAFAWPATFAAHAAVLIQKTRYAPRLDADPSEPMTTIAQGVTEEEVNSEIAVLTSAEVLTTVMKNTGLDHASEPFYVRALFAPLRGYESAYAWWHDLPAPTQTDRAMRRLSASISATRMKDSNVMVATYEAGDPKVAETVLNELLNRYLDRHLSVHRPTDVQGFYSKQATVLAAELRDYEEQLRILKEKMGISEAAVERDLALRLDATLREEESMLRRRRAELDASVASYESRVQSTPTLTTTSTSRQGTTALDELKKDVLLLELEQVSLNARYKPDYPLVVAHNQKLQTARAAVEAERAQLAEASTSTMSPVAVTVAQEFARLSAERAGVRARLATADGQLASSRDRIMRLDALTMEVKRIERLMHTTEQRYLMYIDREDKARLDTALDQGRFTNVSVVQRATASPRPVRPKRFIVLIVALAGGFMVALLTCASLELGAVRPRHLIDLARPHPAEA